MTSDNIVQEKAPDQQRTSSHNKGFTPRDCLVQAAASAFLGAAFLGAAAFFTVVAFFAGAFLVPEVVFCLLTLPDLVFFRTVGASVTAGAWISLAYACINFHNTAYWCFCLCGLGLRGSLCSSVCLWLGSSSLLRDSGLLCLGGGSLGFGGLGLCDLWLCVLRSLFLLESKSGTRHENMVVIRTLTAAFFSPAGLAAGLVSLTGPEGPVMKVRVGQACGIAKHSPLGCWKSPFSTPVFKALLKRESNWSGELTEMLLLAWTYFLMA